MFARTFTFITLIAATVLGVNAACDNGLPGYTHIVVSGDTCYAIAAQGGIDVTRLQGCQPRYQLQWFADWSKGLRSQQL
ncbi:hypothetical protein F5146DRAFT_1092524, partial [Armillaria mellea]